MGFSVLIVDDDEAIRDFVVTFLSEEGYGARGAGDAYEAMDEVSLDPPDLILLDLMMPGVSGAEFLARLRRDERRQDLPVIILSAHPRLREIAIEVGAVAALSKPFEISELLLQVDRILGPPGLNGGSVH